MRLHLAVDRARAEEAGEGLFGGGGRLVESRGIAGFDLVAQRCALAEGHAAIRGDSARLRAVTVSIAGVAVKPPAARSRATAAVS